MKKHIISASMILTILSMYSSGIVVADSAVNITSKVGITFREDGKKDQQIKFDANGGSSQQKVIYGALGERVELSKVKGATRSDYTFCGWYTSKTGNTKMPKSVKLKKGGVTYYAHWKAIPSSIVYRVYNPNTGEHFYPTSVYERDQNVKAGWRNEGKLEYAPTSGTPIYRVYNPNAKGGDHYYTTSKYEASSLVKGGWKWDNKGKPVFYSGGEKSVYVAYNPNAKTGAHSYTMSSFEENSLLHGGWKFGATAWKALK